MPLRDLQDILWIRVKWCKRFPFNDIFLEFVETFLFNQVAFTVLLKHPLWNSSFFLIIDGLISSILLYSLKLLDSHSHLKYGIGHMKYIRPELTISKS